MIEGPGFAAFDAACVEFETSLSEQTGGGLEIPPRGLDLDTLDEVLGQISKNWSSRAPSNAAARAQDLLDMYHVLKAARGLVNDQQAADYANKIHLLHIEYDSAAAAAMRGHDYSFSAELRQAAGTLSDAYNRVQNDVAAMNLVASALNGAAALIAALV